MNNYYGGQQWAAGSRPSEVLPMGVVNSFVQRVYVVMAAGLAITGLVAWLAFGLFFTSSPAGVQIAEDLWMTSAGEAAFSGITRWIIMLAPFAFVMVLSFGINRLSYFAATLLFVAFAGVMGLSLSSIFALYTSGSIAMTFFVTAGTFGAMSVYGMTTKADLTKLGSYLMMGLFGIIIASFANFFFQSGTFSLIISILGVIIFTGLTAYDTQNIMRQSLTMEADSEAAKKASLMGALTLYLDFLNLFLFLLRLMGDRR